MTNIRQQKVGRLIQKEIADIFIKEGSPLCGQAMLTVTRVRMSPDLSFARVYISVFAVQDKEVVVQEISARAAEVRHMLGRRIGKHMRKVPELAFFLDDSIDYEARIDDLLKK